MKFKVGDRVRIIRCYGIERYELNQIGIIKKILSSSCRGGHYIINMGRPRRPNELENFCWWVYGDMLELARRKNEQLVFNFMME